MHWRDHGAAADPRPCRGAPAPPCASARPVAGWPQIQQAPPAIDLAASDLAASDLAAIDLAASDLAASDLAQRRRPARPVAAAEQAPPGPQPRMPPQRDKSQSSRARVSPRFRRRDRAPVCISFPALGKVALPSAAE